MRMRKILAAVLKDGWTKALCAGVSLFASLAVTAGATVTVGTVTRGNPRSKISVTVQKTFSWPSSEKAGRAEDAAEIRACIQEGTKRLRSTQFSYLRNGRKVGRVCGPRQNLSKTMEGD